MATPGASTQASAQLIVACLCAQWCSSCREYRATFDQVAREFAGVRFVWVDVEDEAALVDGIDVENFPTIVIGSDGGPHFFGPLTPQPEILQRLVRAHARDGAPTYLQDRKLGALLAHLRALSLE